MVLDAAERSGHELPYSCRSGGCLSCAARVLSGEAELGEQFVLEDEHIEQGFVLLCVTQVKGPASFRASQQDEIE